MGSEVDSLLAIGVPERDVEVYRLSGFRAPDAVICVRVAGKTYLAVPDMEYERAKREARVDGLVSFNELGVGRLTRELGSSARALAAATAGMLAELGNGGGRVSVPPSLDVVYADELRDRGLAVWPDEGLFAALRRTKTRAEVSRIVKVQRAVEEACARAVEILEESETGQEDRVLRWRGGALTSERLRAEIDVELLRRGCWARNTIVAGGKQATESHERGSGPLKAGEAIKVDVFPMDQESGYYADMARTFVKGEPNEGLRDMYEAVLDAQDAALAMIRAGVDGRDVHERVCDVLHERGHRTTKHDKEDGKPLTEGFTHDTGHGIGLEVHERPLVCAIGEELKAGDVIAVEPSLYYAHIGGVCVEDLVLVTEEGCRNLTRFPKRFVLR